jgi:cytochrome c-type biogenesis protein CcmH/NrfF
MAMDRAEKSAVEVVLRRSIVLSGLGAMAGASGLGALAVQSPRAESLIGRFIAPCCWRENLSLHHSPLADELRGSIREMVAEGKSDADIQAVLVAKYTERILAIPEGSKGQWLTWTPVAATLAGVGAVGLVLQKSLGKRIIDNLPPQGNPKENLPVLPETEWD